jgi:hypothetical protein
MKRIVRRTLVIIISLGNPLWVAARQKPIILHNQRELFADNYLLENLDKFETRLGVPVSGGVALKFNESWEGAFAGAYISIINDGTRYRMYYRGQGAGNGANGEVTCYAESIDGIIWKKPDLNLLETQGTRHNNVVMKGSLQQSSHNLSVIYDDRPDVPAAQRYKAVGGVASSLRHARGLYRYISSDGINWSRLQADTTALFRDGYGMDSQNVLAWLPSENTYAIYLRKWTEDKPGDTKLLKGVRTIARSVSKDFLNWSEPVTMSFGDTPLENLYTNATQPYFRAPQILISMPFRFSPDSRILTDDEMKANGIDVSMWKGISDAVLLTSRGGNAYERKFMESFVRPGSDQRNWAARSTIPALGVIPTGKNEMSFFVTRAYGTKDSYLERMILRTDGFASLHAGFIEGNAITKPLILKGNHFSINYSTSSVGYVSIVLLDERGAELPGFAAQDAEKIVGDKIDAKIKWKSGRTIKELGNKKVRIKFIAKDADLYSIEVSDL